MITLLEHSVDPTLNNSLCTLGQRGYERRTRIVEFERKKLCERVFVPCFHLSRSFRNESINPSYAKPSHLYSIHLTVHVHTSTVTRNLRNFFCLISLCTKPEVLFVQPQKRRYEFHSIPCRKVLFRTVLVHVMLLIRVHNG